MAEELQDQALVEAIATQFAGAIAMLLGGVSIVTPGTQPPAEGWQVQFGIDGRGGPGLVWLGLAAKDAAAVAKRILGVDEDPAEGALRDTLRELAGQAANAVMLEPIGGGLDIHVDGVQPSFLGIPATPPTAWTCDLGDGFTIALGAWSRVKVREPIPVGQAPAPAAPARAATHATSDNFDLILDIDLPMSVRFGRTELALGALTRLGPGSIIDLGRSPDDPVEVLVSGRVVARGDVVVVGGNYGVRITDVVSASKPRQD